MNKIFIKEWLEGLSNEGLIKVYNLEDNTDKLIKAINKEIRKRKLNKLNN